MSKDQDWNLSAGVTLEDLKGATVEYTTMEWRVARTRVGVFGLSVDPTDDTRLVLAIHDSEWLPGEPHGKTLTLELSPEEVPRVELHPDPSVAQFRVTGLFAL